MILRAVDAAFRGALNAVVAGASDPEIFGVDPVRKIAVTPSIGNSIVPAKLEGSVRHYANVRNGWKADTRPKP
jgi:hypothetical protein